MKRNAILTLGLLFATLIPMNVSAQEGSSQQKPRTPLTGTINGVVVNESGYPLTGAAVYVRPLNSTALGRTVLTDAEGKFAVHGLDSTLYKVWASAPAYVMPESFAGDRTRYHRVGDSVRIELVAGGVITGKVTSASGAPVIGIRVRALFRSTNRQTFESAPASAERLTDDRGVYRIYGLAAGTYVVSAGGSGLQWSALNPYDGYAPTFAPSSTIDSAAEIIVRPGQESNVDIRYRVDPGRLVTGVVRSAGKDGATVSLTPVSNNGLFATSNSYLNPETNSFIFYGVPDGDYDLVAHSGIGTAGAAGSGVTSSETKRIAVKGNDVTGLEIVLQPMGFISGHISLESLSLAECRGKRRPALREMMVDLVRNRSGIEEAHLRRVQDGPSLPDENGGFAFRNVRPGEYAFRPQFFAQFWYLQAISLAPKTANTAARKGEPAGTKRDVARHWTTIKTGDRITDLRISLAEGAASLRGQVISPEETKLADPATVYLVPSEQDKREDVLRFFAAETDPNGNFALTNVAPGSYWMIAIRSTDAQLTPSNISLPSSSESRRELRQSAAKANIGDELKPCQQSENIRVTLRMK